MDAQQKARDTALHAIVGLLLCSDISPDVCRLFSPRTFDRWAWATTVSYMAGRTVVPPQVGQLLRMPVWEPEQLLTGWIVQVMLDYPDATPRDHLVGGFFALTLAPWLRADRRKTMGAYTGVIVRMTVDQAVADQLPDRGRMVLDAYDRALAQVAARHARDSATDGADT